MARTKTGDEIKQTKSIRIEPTKHKTIVKAHGSFQGWLDKMVEREIKIQAGRRPPR